MIKKETKAIFLDGSFAGEHDRKGGIPLSEGEQMTIKVPDGQIEYMLIHKEIVYDATNNDQIVTVTYTFQEV